MLAKFECPSNLQHRKRSREGGPPRERSNGPSRSPSLKFCAARLDAAMYACDVGGFPEVKGGGSYRDLSLRPSISWHLGMSGCVGGRSTGNHPFIACVLKSLLDLIEPHSVCLAKLGHETCLDESPLRLEIRVGTLTASRMYRLIIMILSCIRVPYVSAYLDIYLPNSLSR